MFTIFRAKKNLSGECKDFTSNRTYDFFGRRNMFTLIRAISQEKKLSLDNKKDGSKAVSRIS